jgi:hypothetical protein
MTIPADASPPTSPQPPRRSRRALVVVLVSLLALALCCGAIPEVLTTGDHEGLFTAYSMAREKLDAFCEAYIVPDSAKGSPLLGPAGTVADAYELLSPALRAQMSQDDFIRYAGARHHGGFLNCDVNRSSGQANGRDYIFTLTLRDISTEQVVSEATGPVTIVRNGFSWFTAWYIGAIDPALDMLPPRQT